MKKILILLLIVSFATSCSKFEDWNVDKKHPSKVSAEALVTNAQEYMATRMASPSVNYNIFKLFSQYWTETTYIDESNYDLIKRDVGGNFWFHLYDILNDLKDAKRIVDEDGSLDSGTKANKKAVIDLMQVYLFHVLVDTYGDVPYSEALDIENVTPKYDDDQAIYNDLFERITSDINQLNGGGASFGNADLFYSGDVSKWKKFGNSLKLRMAIRIADVDAAKANTMATEALNDGVFASNADNLEFHFLSEPPHTNPIWSALVQSGRHDFVVANTFVDNIDPLNDPRVPFYMDDNVVPYKGGPYGYNNSYNSYTHIGEPFHQPDMPYVLLGYDEVEFLKAEAAERNIGGLTPADAETHYKEAITASMVWWGVSAPAIATYLAQPDVAYATAATNWKEKIGVQKWLALYGRGFEAWSSWRRLGFPTMNVPPIPKTPNGEVPRRYIYPLDEPDVNVDNYNAAAAAMGGDNLLSKVFWDQ